MAGTKTGYCNGSDLLLLIDGKAVGHCTSHSVTFNSDTKDHAVKPAASAALSSSKWKSKSVTGQSYSITAEGLVCYDETEGGFKTLLAAWKTGKSVEVQCLERGSDTTPYLKGNCIISSLEKTAPAEDDATYTINLENDGEPEVFDASKITGEAISE